MSIGPGLENVYLPMIDMTRHSAGYRPRAINDKEGRR